MAVIPDRPGVPPGESERNRADRCCPLCGRTIRCGDDVTRVHGSTVHTRCTRSHR